MTFLLNIIPRKQCVLSVVCVGVCGGQVLSKATQTKLNTLSRKDNENA